MRAYIGAAENIAGDPKKLRLELQSDDMPSKVLLKVLRDIGYDANLTHDRLVCIVPHKEAP